MKLLVVDDHPLVRAGVASTLQHLAGSDTVLQAGDGVEALAHLAQHPDVAAVLLDLRMSGMAGMALLIQLQRQHPGLPALVLSSSEDPEDVRRVLKAGARGYCPKSANPTTVIAALQLVLSGEIYVPPFMAMATSAPEAAPEIRMAGTSRLKASRISAIASMPPSPSHSSSAGTACRSINCGISSAGFAATCATQPQPLNSARMASWIATLSSITITTSPGRSPKASVASGIAASAPEPATMG
jgi:two-component system nitrate/nitrite response regulator NarL